MKVFIRKDQYSPYEEAIINDNMTLEDLYLENKDKYPYIIVAGIINNEVKPLTSLINEGDKIQLIDMRTQHGNLIYQHGLSLIFVKAVWDVMGNVPVYIHNSLNKGLYIEINEGKSVAAATLKEIYNRMKLLVQLNLPINDVEVTCKEALEFLEKYDMEEKKQMLLDKSDISTVTISELDGYYDFFYDVMVPSTGYIKIFELMKYRNGVVLRFPHMSNPGVIPRYVDEKNLYDAFAEMQRWQNLLNIEFVEDLNRQIRNGDMREVIQLSEALHEKKIVEIAKDICERNKRIILIAGPSSSGKTTFARRLCIQLKVNGKNPLYLGTDDYFVNREDTPLDENGEKNYENLDAVDVEMFNDHMNKLLAGETVDLPEFDFIDGVKIFGKRITKIDKNQPIVIEGIHALNGFLTKNIDEKEKYRIYISPLTGLNIDRHNRVPTTDERMLRRMVRDYKYRGKSAQLTIKEWPKVRAGEDKNIFPYSSMADAFFNSVHIYEISVLKKYVKPLLENVKKDEEEYAEAKRLLEFLDFFDTFEDDEIIVNNSILREFIGNSVFA